MYTIKLVLRKKFAEDTEGYIKVAVWLPGASNPILKPTGHKVPVSAWSAKFQCVNDTVEHYEAINEDIAEQRKNVKEQLAKSEGAAPMSAPLVQLKIKSTSQDSGDFLQFYHNHVQYLRSKCNKNYCDHFDFEYRRLKKFAGSELSFSDINTDLLEAFEAATACAVTTKNTKFKRLKEVIDKAIARGFIKTEQIAGYKWPQPHEVETDYLTYGETEEIANALYEGEFDHDPEVKVTAAYFLIECYSGIRHSDWSRFKVEKLLNDRGLKIGGTKKNKQPVYLRFSKFPSLKKVVEYIERNNLKYEDNVNNANRHLKAVKAAAKLKRARLTTHLGRHTFGTLLGESGASLAFIAQAMAISEQTAKRYRKITRKGLDQELERIGGF
jgi:integrase